MQNMGQYSISECYETINNICIIIDQTKDRKRNTHYGNNKRPGKLIEINNIEVLHELTSPLPLPFAGCAR